MFSRNGSGMGVVPVVKRVLRTCSGSQKNKIDGAQLSLTVAPGRWVMRNAQRFFAPVFVILALVLASSFLFADVTGSILGVVRDPSQAVIKGVRVTVTNTQTNLYQDSVTGDDGSFHFL